MVWPSVADSPWSPNRFITGSRPLPVDGGEPSSSRASLQFVGYVVAANVA